VYKLQRWIAIAVLPVIAVIAVTIRYFLFSRGVLYGQDAAKMASLTVAGVIVFAGALPLRVLRADTAAGSANDSVFVVVAAALGLATAAYGVSEILAPNTPVAASAPACAGVPVYGSKYYALTPQLGANARQGGGRAFAQTHRYAGNCTLGFDGYCIGPAEPDIFLHTPDQRWLIVHHRDEVISAGVVQAQSAESQLGERPDKRCSKLGGLPQPERVQSFTYDAAHRKLTAVAPNAVAVGYVLASVTADRANDKVLGFGTREKATDFPVSLDAATIAVQMQHPNGEVRIGAAACLADNVPVVTSLNVRRLTYQGSRIVKDEAETGISGPLSARLADLACNSGG
jgi:hypothetical protein